MMSSPNLVPRLYQSVIDDVVTNVREFFLDDGVDEQVLQELKQLWEGKLHQTKAVKTVEPKEDLKAPMTGLYAHQLQQQQRQQLLQHKQEQRAHTVQQTSAASVAGHMVERVQSQTVQQPQASSASNQVQPVPGQQMPGQLQMLNQPSGQFDLGNSAQSLQNIYPGGTVTIQTPNGPMQFLLSQPGASVTLPVNTQNSNQLDGKHDNTSSEEEEDDDDDDDDDDKDDENGEDQAEEEEPLNSSDDISEEDHTELFDTDNVVVCQFDKINRAKNKWKFYLKDGIMNLNGTDYVFQKCHGDAEW